MLFLLPYHKIDAHKGMLHIGKWLKLHQTNMQYLKNKNLIKE
jgi:hypothetical protein